MNSVEKHFDEIRQILENLPTSWVSLTTHSLDNYHDGQGKSQFITQLQAQLALANNTAKSLSELPTAYDYIRLGHQLSCVLEWALATINNVPADQVIAYTSKTMPILAILRKNTLDNIDTQIYYDLESSPLLDQQRLEEIYGYKVLLHEVTDASQVAKHGDSCVVFVTESPYKSPLSVNGNIDVTVNLHRDCGSAIVIHNAETANLVDELQHVRRRETIAMTPPNTLKVLREIVGEQESTPQYDEAGDEAKIHGIIKDNTGSSVAPLIASSGLSIQYAILMGLVENAMTQHPDKAIKIILPPNCYGGTNDQARRITDLNEHIDIVDLLVDGDQNLVSSLDQILESSAQSDSVPIVLAEIPTNPRVEVPDMSALGAVLNTSRVTADKKPAIAPVFIVDQTFCPNVKLLGQESELADTKVISYSSASKFPSGGLCIGGYCAVNDAAEALQVIISKHLALADNRAISHQLKTLVENMPSMPERITAAYFNAKQFVAHINQVLPEAKINFVSETLAAQGFTPSVFSLDLPPQGKTAADQEENKRIINRKLIDFMIEKHPENCKHCVSYGQLKGCYWTIPATSTQGTTKEGDKDYIVRVALSPQIDVEQLSASFSEFCHQEGLV